MTILMVRIRVITLIVHDCRRRVRTGTVRTTTALGTVRATKCAGTGTILSNLFNQNALVCGHGHGHDNLLSNLFNQNALGLPQGILIKKI